MSTVLVIGSGAREHAIGWRLALSPKVTRMIVAPGNPGMPRDWERWLISLKEGTETFENLAIRCREEKVDLAVIGPDDPLAEGITDILEAQGIRVVGPTQAAARIESSKVFGKEVMTAAKVPTAKYWAFTSQEEARNLLKSLPWPSKGHPVPLGWVVKADGLALGKGVRVCSTVEEALQAVNDLSRISDRWIIEERLEGQELSWMAFCDGTRCALLEPARDYKRLLDQDEGPNTGGMGAFSPVPGIPSELPGRVLKEVFLPTLQELKKRGCPFRGVLYAGLMADSQFNKFWVLEFNARFGDPEAQVLLPRLEGDLFEWFDAIARGSLNELPEQVPFAQDFAVYVVAASSGYPEHPKTGDQVLVPGSRLANTFFAGVRLQNKDLITSGGRVLGVLGTGPTLTLARDTAYRQLSEVKFQGMQYRTDIGAVK